MNAQSVTTGETKSLDDVMLAMDIVDTLRHRERLIDRELSVEAREAKLIARLKEIYSAQGIEVPERILADGVKALEEQRFAYKPPQNSFSVRLAKFYIGRDRWMKPLLVIMGLAAFSTALWEFGFEAPQRVEARRVQTELTETIPANLARYRDDALAIAQTPTAIARIETAYQNGVAASEDGDAATANAYVEDLSRLTQILGYSLDIRIVSRPDEFSGVFRTHDDDPSIRNYYLIVEAIDDSGRVQTIEIASEEDQRRQFTERWGLRVSETEFNRVAADKNDDQIIQNAIIGEKPRGALNPTYTINAPGGAILEW